MVLRFECVHVFSPASNAYAMNLQRLLLCSLFAAALPHCLIAQPSYLVFYPQDMIDLINLRHEDRSGIEGSPYLNRQFTAGEVFYTSKNKVGEDFYDRDNHYTGIPLRYNIYQNEMEFYSKDEQPMTLIPMPLIDKVVIGEDTFAFRPWNAETELGGYFNVLVDGPAKLFVKMNVEFNEAQPAKALEDAVPAHYKRKRDTYYLEQPDGALLPIKRLKKLTPRLTANEDRLRSFIKEQNISARNPEELTRLVRFYNRLLLQQAAEP